MTSRHAPTPTLQQRLYWPTVVACATVGIAGLTGMAHGVAPKVAADTSFTAFPEQVAEPSAHGGLGGPLTIPTIGTTVTDDSAYGPDPLSAPRTATGPRSGLSGGPTTPPSAPTGLTAASSATPAAATTTPAPSTTPQTVTAAAATTATPPTTTAPATTDTPTPTTQEATTTSATTTAATTEEDEP